MSAVEKAPSKSPESEDQGLFGNVEENIARAIDEAVTERRRLGLPIAVDRGHGVELIP